MTAFVHGISIRPLQGRSLFALCLATGLAGLIVVFPLLGHATWHAYKGLPAPEAALS